MPGPLVCQRDDQYAYSNPVLYTDPTGKCVPDEESPRACRPTFNSSLRNFLRYSYGYEQRAYRGGDAINIVFDQFPEQARTYQPQTDQALRGFLVREAFEVDPTIAYISVRLTQWRLDNAQQNNLPMPDLGPMASGIVVLGVANGGLDCFLSPDGGGRISGSGRLGTPGDKLPLWKKGQKVRGVLDLGTEQIDLVSGRSGPAASMPDDAPGMRRDMAIRDHVEAHAAATMRQRGIKEATLYINKHPCPGPLGCDNNLAHMLPEGATLHVKIKVGENQWETKTYGGVPDSQWRWP